MRKKVQREVRNIDSFDFHVTQEKRSPLKLKDDTAPCPAWGLKFLERGGRGSQPPCCPSAAPPTPPHHRSVLPSHATNAHQRSKTVILVLDFIISFLQKSPKPLVRNLENTGKQTNKQKIANGFTKNSPLIPQHNKLLDL